MWTTIASPFGGGAQDAVEDMSKAAIIASAKFDLERLRRHTNDPWAEVEGVRRRGRSHQDSNVT